MNSFVGFQLGVKIKIQRAKNRKPESQVDEWSPQAYLCKIWCHVPRGALDFSQKLDTFFGEIFNPWWCLQEAQNAWWEGGPPFIHILPPWLHLNWNKWPCTSLCFLTKIGIKPSRHTQEILPWNHLNKIRHARTFAGWCSKPDSTTLWRFFTKRCVPAHQSLREWLWVVPAPNGSVAWAMRRPVHAKSAEDRQKWMSQILGSTSSTHPWFRDFPKNPSLRFAQKKHLWSKPSLN